MKAQKVLYKRKCVALSFSTPIVQLSSEQIISTKRVFVMVLKVLNYLTGVPNVS